MIRPFNPRKRVYRSPSKVADYRAHQYRPRMIAIAAVWRDDEKTLLDRKERSK